MAWRSGRRAWPSSSVRSRRAGVSATNAKAVLATVFETGESPREVIARDGLGQVSDEGAIGAEIDAVIAEFPSQVAEYRAGQAPSSWGSWSGR